MSKILTPKILTIDDSRLLFSALGANGLFSTVCGVLMLSASQTIARTIGLADSRWILATGVVLVLFGGGLLFHWIRQRISKTEVLLISAMDLGWVLGTAALLLALPGLFSTVGIKILIGIGVIVFMFFELQAYALWKVLRRS